MKILIAVIPLLAGFLLDCLLGDPYSLPHPIRLIGRFISSLEKWVRCRFSSQLVLGGVVMSIIVLLTSALIPLGFLVLCLARCCVGERALLLYARRALSAEREHEGL